MKWIVLNLENLHMIFKEIDIVTEAYLTLLTDIRNNQPPQQISLLGNKERSNDNEKLINYKLNLMKLREEITIRINELDNFYEDNFEDERVSCIEKAKIRLKKLLMYDIDTLDKIENTANQGNKYRDLNQSPLATNNNLNEDKRNLNNVKNKINGNNSINKEGSNKKYININRNRSSSLKKNNSNKKNNEPMENRENVKKINFNCSINNNNVANNNNINFLNNNNNLYYNKFNSDYKYVKPVFGKNADLKKKRNKVTNIEGDILDCKEIIFKIKLTESEFNKLMKAKETIKVKNK